MFKKVLSIILLLCLIFMIFVPAYAQAVSYNDISGHWAEKEIINMTDNGIIQGYNGLFRPDDCITRQETTIIINNLMDYAVTGTNNFKDVPISDYTESILKVYAAGIMVGDGDGYFRPQSNITIQEAIKVIISTFQIPLTNDYSCLSRFKDASTIANWAKPYISTFVSNGYLGDNARHFDKIRANESITRAEFVYLLNQVFDKNINKEQTIKNTTYEKDIVVTADNVAFQNCKLKKVYIAPSVDITTITFDSKTTVEEVKDLSVDLYKDLKKTNGNYIYLISSFSTAFDSSNTNRSTNLKLSLEAINGTILYPDETFSFNNTVGERTAAKGYKVAGIIIGGKNSKGLGGGICQTATTLYNAALLAGLQISERHQHSTTVSYVNLGKDATVYWSSNLDLKFKNTYSTPIKIIGEYNSKGTITFSIYSSKRLNLPKIEVKTYKENGVWITQQIIDGKVKYTAKSTY